MISELYSKIAEAVSQIRRSPDEAPLVKHIDLWNRNVEFIEEDSPWDCPAVFIEIGEVSWRQISGAVKSYQGSCELTLHVVTRWAGNTSYGELGSEASVSSMDLSELISRAVLEVNGMTFGNIKLLSSAPNHDHDDIIECIERFSIELIR